jgi:hypothetical protein
VATDPETTKAVLGAASQLANDVYKDVAQPAARRVGIALETVFKIGLSPFAMLDAGYEHSKDWIQEKITARVADTPENCVVVPPNNIAVPVMVRIAMSTDAPDLRDLYAELLLKAMDSRTASLVHPAYVLLIEQLSAEEAFVFVNMKTDDHDTIFSDKFSATQWFGTDRAKTIEEQFADTCVALSVPGPERSQIWLDNLIRLGLVELKVYAESEFVPAEYHKEGVRPASVSNDESRYLRFTAFGKGFRIACAPPAVTVGG